MELENYLKEKKIWYRFIEKSETIHTADAAKVAGLELNRLTKNLVSKTDSENMCYLLYRGTRKSTWNR